ncbi:MAG: hypothetical protein ACI9XZ_001766, partial [Alphaproteobacteria bacterium]
MSLFEFTDCWRKFVLLLVPHWLVAIYASAKTVQHDIQIMAKSMIPLSQN